MRVIDHQPGAIALLELDHAGKIRNVAFGGIEALDDDERVFVLGALLAQDFLQRLEIVVLVGERLGARQAHADNGAVVHELVMHDEILRAHDGADGRHVGGMTADEHQRSFNANCLGDLLLQLAVQRRIAGNHTARRHRGAISIDGGLGSLDQVGVLAETEVVAPGEVEDGLAVDQRAAALRALGRAEEWVLDAEQFAEVLVIGDRLIGRQRRKAVWRPCRGRAWRAAYSMSVA